MPAMPFGMGRKHRNLRAWPTPTSSLGAGGALVGANSFAPLGKNKARRGAGPLGCAARVSLRDTLNTCILPLFRNAQPKARFWLGLQNVHLRARFGGPSMGRTDAPNCSEHP